MLKINIESLNEKLSNFLDLPIKEQYQKSLNIFNALNTADSHKVNEIFEKTGFSLLYKNAESCVKKELEQGLKIIPNLSQLELALIYPDSSKDSVVKFFDVSNFVNKITSSNVERVVIMGFLMKEETMTCFQIYNHVSPDISKILET